MATFYAIPAGTRRDWESSGVLAGLEDPWRRAVLRRWSAADIRAWHIILVGLLIVGCAYPVVFVGVAAVVVWFVVAAIGIGLIAWFFLG